MRFLEDARQRGVLAGHPVEQAVSEFSFGAVDARGEDGVLDAEMALLLRLVMSTRWLRQAGSAVSVRRGQ